MHFSVIMQKIRTMHAFCMLKFSYHAFCMYATMHCIHAMHSMQEPWLNAWPFWGGVALFNLKFVELNLRLLVIKIASLVWNTFLAMQVKLAYDNAKMVERTG